MISLKKLKNLRSKSTVMNDINFNNINRNENNYNNKDYNKNFNNKFHKDYYCHICRTKYKYIKIKISMQISLLMKKICSRLIQFQQIIQSQKISYLIEILIYGMLVQVITLTIILRILILSILKIHNKNCHQCKITKLKRKTFLCHP